MASPDTAGSGSGRIFNVPPVVVAFALLLAVIHIGLTLAGEQIALWAMLVFGFIPAQISGAWQASLPGAKVWSFLTHALLHGSFSHLISNVLWLVVFGGLLAQRFGIWRFFIHAAVCAAAGGAAALVFNWGAPDVYIGASGIVSGQMAASTPLIFAGGRSAAQGFRGGVTGVAALRPMELFTNSRALIFFALWIAVTLVTGAAGGLQAGGDSVRIAWDSHLGGFLAGLAAFYLLDPGPVRG